MNLTSTEFELAGLTYRAELRRNSEFVFFVKGDSKRCSREYDPFVKFGDDSYYFSDNYQSAPLGSKYVFKLKAQLTEFFSNLLSQSKAPKLVFFHVPSLEKASIYLNFAHRIGLKYGYRISIDKHRNVLLTKEQGLRINN